GNAASLQLTGTLDGASLAYKDNKALDFDSSYTVTVPNLDVARTHVEAKSEGTFVQIGSLQLNTLTATTTYAERRLVFQTHVVQAPSAGPADKAAGLDVAARELDASGSAIFHPDHQEIHLPNFAARTRGVEWRTAPGADATIKYGQDRIELQNVRLVNADQSIDVDGTFALGE